jgi:hypothetical protein
VPDVDAYCFQRFEGSTIPLLLHLPPAHPTVAQKEVGSGRVSPSRLLVCSHGVFYG